MCLNNFVQDCSNDNKSHYLDSQYSYNNFVKLGNDVECRKFSVSAM